MSSKFIAQAMGGSVSPATIRNELADLVEMGYLEQPHTSAGRVPSPRGYRLYVNELMERRSIPAQDHLGEGHEQLRPQLGGQTHQLLSHLFGADAGEVGVEQIGQGGQFAGRDGDPVARSTPPDRPRSSASRSSRTWAGPMR